MVGSFLVGEELVRFVVLIEIVNLVRPTVEDFLGFHPFGAQYNRNVLQFVAKDTAFYLL